MYNKNEMTPVIAQRVKLACSDMGRMSYDEVLAKLVSQERDMTAAEIADEVSYVKAMTEQITATIAGIRLKICEKIMIMRCG